MSKYKIEIDYESDYIEAENEQEAMEEWCDELNLSGGDFLENIIK